MEKAGRFSEEQGGGDYIPKCTWLDGDHTNDIANSALKFDVEAYGEKVLDTAGKDACAPTIYGPDNDPIAGRSSSFVFPRNNISLTTVCRSARPTQEKRERTSSMDGEQPCRVQLH